MLTRLKIWFLTLLGRDPRGLFRFYDGQKWRAVDPLETLRAFFAYSGSSSPSSAFDWDETIELFKSGQATIQLDAFRRIAMAVRAVFGIKPASEGGLSEQACFELFGAFRSYLGDIKKNGSLFPISLESMDSGLLDPSEIPAKPGLGYGSTLKEPLPVPPGSPVEPTIAGTAS